jgi:hypothetical protein
MVQEGYDKVRTIYALMHIVDLEAGIVGVVQRSSFQGTQIQKVVSCCEQLYAHRGA